MKLRDLIEDIDILIKNGKSTQAQRRLKGLRHRRIPRNLAGRVANLARRASLPYLSLRILHPVVRPLNPSQGRASDREKAEYAAALTYVGASGEAVHLLKDVDLERTPEALLFTTFALFAQWDYPAAIPLLQRYVAVRELDDYGRIVGKVNLAAALIFDGQHETAEVLLRELESLTNTEKTKLLHGNVLELWGQNAVFQKRWDEADQHLSRAAKVLENRSGLFELFVRKWRVLSHLLRHGPDKDRLERVAEIRREAIGFLHWETVRDCDLFVAIASKDAALFHQVHFGTPFDQFRRRGVRLMGGAGAPPLPEVYVWNPYGSGEPTRFLSTNPGMIPDTDSPLPPANVHQVLCVLASDFYSSFRLASLFARIYPTEYFNPESSPPRVYRLLQRLKVWLAKETLPLSINEARRFYRMTASAPVGIVVGSEVRAEGRNERYLDSLKARWGEKTFTASEATKTLGISRRSTLRFLEQMRKSGTTLREGAG